MFSARIKLKMIVIYSIVNITLQVKHVYLSEIKNIKRVDLVP